MKTKILELIALGLLTGCLLEPVASAAPLELIATSQNPYFGGFDVVFDDVVGDGLLRQSEVTSFSGVTSLCTPNCSIFESKLLLVPDVAGVSSGSGSSWGFGNDVGGQSLQAVGAASLWTYAVSTAPVPEPGTFPLLALGIAGLGVMRLRNPGRVRA